MESKLQTTIYAHYLMAYGQVVSGNDLGYEDYRKYTDTQDSEWVDLERCIAITLGAEHAAKVVARNGNYDLRVKYTRSSFMLKEELIALVTNIAHPKSSEEDDSETPTPTH